ncbi:TfuA-like protein [Streptomyces sp. NPDC006335]|uniref:TfuA-like protein n=1 Tax=Streptomyces sp. NPDC006335 TaxID=3156895 RepID=UPI0033B6F238
MQVHAFIGPTAAHEAVRKVLPDCLIHPPAQHGDFIRRNFTAADIVVLIDGLYHGNPPIRHKEILHTIEGGSTVIGAASMGALRAAELHGFGMVGVGQIFEDFRDGRIEADDEVAVLHTEGPEWQVISEALVNMRYVLERARQASVVSPSEEARLLKVARSLHYPRRSWRAVEQACRGDEELEEAVRRILHFEDGARQSLNLKYQDACAALRYAQALAEPGRRAEISSPSDSWSVGWRTTYLRKWCLEFTGVRVNDRLVSWASQFDYQRLFGHDQTQRWRRYVLSVMTGLPPDASLKDLEDQALVTAAKEQHLDAGSVPAGGTDYWLTGRERRELSARQRMLAVFVRSSRPAADFGDEQLNRWLLPQGMNISELVSSSLDVNEQVALTSFSKHIDHLKVSVLERHLNLLWNLGARADRWERDAAARDRGFASADEAVEALRPFFLKDHNDRLRKGA